MTGTGIPDEHWRRPDPGSTGPNGPADPHRYPGPPVPVPPAPGWSPPVVEQPSPPRRLPAVDDEAIDQSEERAARLTYAIGTAACLILLVLACSHLLR